MASSLSFIARFLIILILIYQHIISLYLGSNCRFTPTCSQYGIEAIQRFGVIKGCWLILRRILKCHPIYSGGNDPVPPKTDDQREH